jgi:hypothetical protein
MKLQSDTILLPRAEEYNPAGAIWIESFSSFDCFQRDMHGGCSLLFLGT